MPSFDNVEVTAKVDIEFEVWCNTCGAGLCRETTTNQTSRGYLSIRVNVCPDCMKEKEDEIVSLKNQIDRLEDKVFELEERVDS